MPISTAAYAGIPQNKTAQASSLLNVARNLGGTIGISSAQTLLASNLQIRQSTLVEHLNPLDPRYNDWLAKAQSAFAGVGDAVTTPLAVLYSQVQRQAAMLAFLDVYRQLMILVLVVAPLVFLMSPSKSGGGGGMAH